MSSKENIISKIYFDPAGFGSVKRTFEDARKKDKTITLEDVREFFQTRVEKKNKAYGFNSFVAPRPYYEYQADLFFINDLENQKYTIGMLMIDIFTKYMVVVPLASKSEKTGDITSGLLECLNKMGKNPEIVYTDNEMGLGTEAVNELLKDKDIDHIITRSKAWFAERAVRTFKSALYKRVENSKKQDVQWTDFIYPILLTYNNKIKHSATNHTPTEARNEKNELSVKLNLLLHKKHTRIYTKLNVDDEVKVFKKKTLNQQKETYSTYLDGSYKIKKITYEHNQPFFELKDFSMRNVPNRFMRSELLNSR